MPARIELFIGSERGNKGKEVLVNADIVYTPDIVLAEIARKYLRKVWWKASLSSG